MTALEEESDQDNCTILYFSNYKIGSIGDDGKSIVAVISRTDNYIIYKTAEGKIGFDAAQEFLKGEKEIIEKFDELSIQITYAIPRRHYRFVNERLGYALANIFTMHYEGGSLFTNVEKCIEDIADDEFQLHYVLSGMTVFCIYGIVFIIVYNMNLSIIDYIKSAFMGSMGASISVIARSRKLKSSGFVSIRYSIIQGFLRTEIGALFGVLGMILVKANIVLGMLSDNPYHIMLISAFAGFNERYVPEAMKYAKE